MWNFGKNIGKKVSTAATYYQQRARQKTSINLNQNDKQVVSQLKDQLLAIMDQETNTLKTQTLENRFRSISPVGASRISASNRDLGSPTSTKHNDTMNFSTVSHAANNRGGFKPEASLYDRFQQSQFGTTAGYLMGLNVHNIAQRKKLMIRKLNELDNKNKQKASHLDNLKKELANL